MTMQYGFFGEAASAWKSPRDSHSRYQRDSTLLGS
jgi:hypothetical protein